MTDGVTNFVVFDGGYRAVSGGETRHSAWCEDCVAGRCECVLDICAAAKVIARKANVVVEGLAGDKWLVLKTYTPVKGGPDGRQA